MKQLIKQFLKNEDGPTAVEYAVMLALIVIACLTSVGLLSNQTAASFDNSATQLNAVLGS
ncbi:Flp family type IVb pilin [Bythopirellula polymerisocia]|uniref:Flp/Fap pilin component n=1 Tax=Bythopirellula polymerisocia TaxID=2528003 RepID=A0A5C6CL66_9BACT|nr:Flp family type IVb pilin [Bythopirellula polymerisocia]TWU25623.1 Flp/Fap pilin component [Bythopirellula polymerisocia]